MKKRLLLLCLIISVIMTGCGNENYSSSLSSSNKDVNGADNGTGFDITGDYAYSENNSYDSSDYEESSDDTIKTETSETSNNQSIDKEMLVYTCDLAIDTLKFSDTIDGIKQLIYQYDGFIECEDYSDGGDSYSYYYVEDENKHQVYSAQIRIPSKDYNNFVDSVGDLGDVRSKNAFVENVTQEYTDAKTALEIYEAKEQRYINMIAETTDESVALQLEENLTDVEIEIAKLRSRITKLSDDVAYSYVNLKVSEVRKYSSHSGVTSTFLQRLLDTIKDSWSSFSSFLEWLLFFSIKVFPFTILIGIVILVIKKIRKFCPKKIIRKHRRINLGKDSDSKDENKSDSN